jgi:outer membrane receptor protein involved in Fe transport
MKKTILAILAAVSFNLLMVFAVKAETFTPDPKGGTISGRVLDAATSQPMEYVSVALFRAADSSLVTGTISSTDGLFKIEKIPAGDYYVKITFLGFENLQTGNINVNTKLLQNDLGDIKLSANTAQLSGVSVTAERSKVEYKIDKRVINVAQDLVAKGGTAVNVLENTPSVQVDAQGNVSLRGSYDYIVLIDGKPSILKGNEALKTINAASIKQIEVITNPSAKYEADGKAGIINIIQKKEKMQGVSGTASLSLGTADKYSGNGLVNYRKGKVNVFAGVDFAKNKYTSDINIHNISYLELGTQYIEESVVQYNNNDNLSGKAGIDYDLNEKNAFTFSGNYGVQGYDNGAAAKYNYYFNSNEQKTYFSSNNDMDVAGNVAGLNFDYTHKFGENHTLSISNYYSSWDGVDENLLTENTTDNNYNPLSVNSSLTFRKDNYNYQYRLNADYKRMIKTGTLEAGFQYRYENRKDDYVFKNLDVPTGEWIVNTMYTYKLDYTNDIYSGYVTYSDTKWGIGYMLGARTEYFTRTISFSNDDTPYVYDKFMLYPSVHLTKSIKEKHQFQLSYSRRINRPQPWVLNKTPGYIDPYNIFQGSPELEPEFTDAFELNYRVSYKITTFSVQTYFRNTTNSFNTRRTLQDNGIMVHELINANSQQSYGVELGLDFNLTKWWQLSTGGNLYHYTLDAVAASGETTRSSESWDARMISNFSLKWGTRLQAVFYTRGPQLDAQGKSTGFYTVNLGVNQPIMKGKVNVGISAENIFNSIKFDYSAVGDNYDNQYVIAAEGMVIRFTASYTFNNFQNKQRGRADDASFKGGGAF